MEGVCSSSLTFLPLSSLTFNEEGSGFLRIQPFQFPDYLICIFLFCHFDFTFWLLSVTDLVCVFKFEALVYFEFQHFMVYMDYFLHLQIDYLLIAVKLITTGVFLTPGYF